MLRKPFGPLLLHLSIPFDYIQTAQSLTEKEINEDVDSIVSAFPAFKEDGLVNRNTLEITSRHYLTMKRLANTQNLDGIAIRCWPELPGPKEASGMDGWCYFALARFNHI